MAKAQFDIIGEEFIEYYDTVRGAIREDLVRSNLEPFLSAQLTTVLDVGGGDGRDAAWFAGMGYEVTLVDPSRDMLKMAQKRFRKLGQGVITVQADDITIREKLNRDYDIVLSHGVFMYNLNNPQAHFDALKDMVKEGGIVSVLTKGFHGSLGRFQNQDSPEAKKLIQTYQTVNNLGAPVWAITPESLLKYVNQSGLKPIQWSGVRIITEKDHRPKAELSDIEYKRILLEEIKQGSDPKTKKLGQMLHVVARS
jgi:SAM-dependent methyltransferase